MVEKTRADAGAELDRLIERAARGNTRDAANELQESWKASERKHREKLRAEHREQWLDFHLGQAARLRRTMTALVEKHEAAAAKLIEGES